MNGSTPSGAQPFRIAARAMRQLGAELITSDEMALYELIKNAFDAARVNLVFTLKEVMPLVINLGNRNDFFTRNVRHGHLLFTVFCTAAIIDQLVIFALLRIK